MQRRETFAALGGTALLMTLMQHAAFAEDLTCVPDTLCIDADCQTGHDDRQTVLLRDWTTKRAVLHSDYGDVDVVRTKGASLMQWSGRNDQGQTETLTVEPSSLLFVYVVQLEPTSAVGKLTTKGACKVTK